MSSSTYNSLTNAGFIPEQPLLVRKTVVTQEKGIKYTLDVKANYPSVVFQVDGCIIRSGRKCDKLVLVNTKGESPEEWTQFFVELKGMMPYMASSNYLTQQRIKYLLMNQTK